MAGRGKRVQTVGAGTKCCISPIIDPNTFATASIHVLRRTFTCAIHFSKSRHCCGSCVSLTLPLGPASETQHLQNFEDISKCEANAAIHIPNPRAQQSTIASLSTFSLCFQTFNLHLITV